MKKLFFIIALLLAGNAYSGGQQEITDFYLSNFREDGSSDWEIKGQKALVAGDYINIETMEANYFLDADTLLVKSNQAKLNQKTQDMHLEGNVEIENSQGWNLKADYLDWQREKEHIRTQSPVKAVRDSLMVKANGFFADSQLEKADFQKNVQVDFSGKKNNEDAVTINCDGPLQIEYSSGKAVFEKNVIIKHQQGSLFSDLVTLFFDTEDETIIKIISEGNVRIVRDNNITLADKATYLAEEEKLTLEGKPRIIYFPDAESGSSGFPGIN